MDGGRQRRPADAVPPLFGTVRFLGEQEHVGTGTPAEEQRDRKGIRAVHTRSAISRFSTGNDQGMDPVKVFFCPRGHRLLYLRELVQHVDVFSL